MGVAIGALAREVRAASLLAFLLSLPIAFLALIPSGAVASGLYDVINVVSACSPSSRRCARWTGRSTAARSASRCCICSALAVAFAVLARLSLRRFA